MGAWSCPDLIGQFMLIEGETRFVHGPLAVAARDGHLLVLNEMDVLDAAELAGLNDIVEGAPLVIAANGGEVIRPHPKFRLIATGNSAGSGDTSGLYQGVLRQNLAFLDRFRVVQVAYPDADDRAGADQDPGAEPPGGDRREDGGGRQRGPPALSGTRRTPARR